MIFRQLFDSVSGTYSYLLASRAAQPRCAASLEGCTAELPAGPSPFEGR